MRCSDILLHTFLLPSKGCTVAHSAGVKAARSTVSRVFLFWVLHPALPCLLAFRTFRRIAARSHFTGRAKLVRCAQCICRRHRPIYATQPNKRRCLQQVFAALGIQVVGPTTRGWEDAAQLEHSDICVREPPFDTWCTVTPYPGCTVPCCLETIAKTEKTPRRHHVETVTKIYSLFATQRGRIPNHRVPVADLLAAVDIPGRTITVTRRVEPRMTMAHSAPETRAWPDYCKIACALVALQRVMQLHTLGLRHNGLHPDVLMVEYQEGHPLDVRFLDLSWASDLLAPANTVVMPSAAAGCALYGSPELLRASASDLWSLGLVLISWFRGNTLEDLGVEPLCFDAGRWRVSPRGCFFGHAQTTICGPPRYDDPCATRNTQAARRRRC